ncbi:MAG: MBL fold metallo-hydrolase [Deltaproteobacteria bacterium]|nr:MAG: MBL fold metallo-hydrolase [Deltaproteobacteria bacterium]
MLRRVDPALVHRDPVESDCDLRMRYLGTAGFELRAGQHTIVVDPFVTRPGLLRTLFGRLRPDVERIRRVLPRADDVLVGHTHYDHVLDAPALCRHTGARLIGSPALAHVARAAGLPDDQVRVTTGQEDIPSGPGFVRGLPSRHGRVYFNRVTLPGDITAPPSWPPRVTELRHGPVLNWYVELGGVRMAHVDSADFIADELLELDRAHQVRSRGIDILCLCAIGRRYRPRYVEEAMELFNPRVIVACHWDLFTTPYEVEPALLPGVDLPGFVDEIRQAGARPIVLPLDGEVGVHART